MERRRILVIAAAIVAALGVVLVLLYVRGADTRAQEKFETVTVLVANQEIAAGESINDASASGKLATQDIVSSAVLPGAQSDITAIQDKFATQTIFPGEQIIAQKFSASPETAVTDSLALPAGKQAVSINLSDTQRVAGFVNPGSEVAIYFSSGGTVRIMLARVQVIAVGSTTTIKTTTTDANGQPVTTEGLPNTMMTLALNQKDAQKIIFAQDNGSVYFGLLNKKSVVKMDTSATSLSNIFS